MCERHELQQDAIYRDHQLGYQIWNDSMALECKGGHHPQAENRCAQYLHQAWISAGNC
jgi:hypothetical protein